MRIGCLVIWCVVEWQDEAGHTTTAAETVTEVVAEEVGALSTFRRAAT